MSTMTKLLNFYVLAIVIINLVLGFQVYAAPYDYSFTHECLAKPLEAQYGGGIVVNPELNEGLKGWTKFGNANIELSESYDGNKYVAVSKRKHSFHSFSQKFNLKKEKLYTFSAWLQVSHENADIAAIFKTKTSYETAGWVTAKKGCWSMLKGGIVVNDSGAAELYFESNNTKVDIWADSISLQPFTQEEWKSHQDQSTEKVRKTRVRFQAVDRVGQPISNATVSIKQQRPKFPLGCAINKNIIGNPAYQNWFLSRGFKYTVFTNELKWYSTESVRGTENYSIPDAMLQFTKAHGISVRGHNVLWDDPQFQPRWVPGLSYNDMWAAVNKRIYSVVKRYAGQLFHWDVVNENLHFNFFESKLGPNASNIFYQKTNQYDPQTTPFLNEYNTLEYSKDSFASPSQYLQRIQEMRKRGYNGPLGIGLEGHFSSVNLPYIRSAIDSLASAKLPIWLTELDVMPGPNQATSLEQIIREAHAHRGVQGIMVWGSWKPNNCSGSRMCLVDNKFKNLPPGDVVDKIINEWSHAADLPGTTDSNGFFETSLFHGEYEVKVNHPNGGQLFSVREIKVAPNGEDQSMAHFTIDV